MNAKRPIAHRHLISGLVLSIFTCAAAHADFIQTTWTVEKFKGEAWFVQPNNVIGKTQMFDGGYAEGFFYSCDFNGHFMAHTTYANGDFFTNTEFKCFAPLRDIMTADSDTLFVHRIT